MFGKFPKIIKTVAPCVIGRSEWRISWRRAVAPAGDWFFRLPGHAHTIRWKNEIHINDCLICPSTSFVIINSCWSPRAIRFGSQYPTAANRSPGSGFCRGLLAFHSFGVWLPGGNRLYVRGRLLSSVALTPGDFAYFSRFKSMGAKRMFSALVHNVACQWTTEINVVSGWPFFDAKKGSKNASGIEMFYFI